MIQVDQGRSQKFLTGGADFFYITFMFLGCNYAKNSIFTIGGGNFLGGVRVVPVRPATHLVKLKVIK